MKNVLSRGEKVRTLIFLAKGFETMEFSVFVDVLGWARNDFGLNTTVTTCGFTKKVISTFNVPVIVDETINNINVDEFDALVIPGGFEEYGFYEEAYDERFLEMIRTFHRKGKIIASVCVGALALGKSGILKGKEATTYHLGNGKWQSQLREFGVKVVNKPIVSTERIITSYCPETAVHVAFLLLEWLTSQSDKEKVKQAMGY